MITKRFKIFSLLGFPIYLDLSWFAIAILIAWSLATGYFPSQVEDLQPGVYWTMGIAGALGLFASILAHELGHAVVARRFDLPISGITLFIFGGVAELTKEPPSPKAEFFVAIAGPIVSVIIALACFAVTWFNQSLLPTTVVLVIAYLALINAVVVAFNLIPAFPLDGGRILRSILWYLKGNLRWATRISSSLGSAFGLFLIILALINLLAGALLAALWQFLIGMFLRNAAQMSYQQVVVRRALEGEPVSRFMRTDVITVDSSLSLDQLVENYIYRFHHKMFPVTDREQLVGCVTTRDVQRIERERWPQTEVGQIAGKCEQDNTITPETDAMEALARFSHSGASRMMVVSNDLVPLENLVYLVKYDSVYGRCPYQVSVDHDRLVLGDTVVPCLSEKSPSKLPWKEMQVDLVFKCSGVFRKQADLQQHLDTGAKQVILSAPPKSAGVPMLVPGVSPRR